MLRAVAIVRLRDLIGQSAPSEFLRGVVAQGRPTTAYLFQGPPGIGKGTAALAFARALLCERVPGGAREGADLSLFDPSAPRAPDPSASRAPLDDACGECPACRKTRVLQHPDLKFLFPVSGEEKELDDAIAATLQGLREDPLFVFAYEKAASIRLSLTRELLRELAYQPFEAARRVVVMRDADKMREDQYSALLKGLEEPGQSTVWVLTTSRPSRLPPTIHSRCQRVRFAPLSESTVRAFLAEHAEVRGRDSGRDEIRILAALSGGSLARALSLRESEPLRVRDEALELLGPALRGDAAGLWRAAQGYMRYGRTGRESLRRMFEIHQLWLRDLLRAKADQPRDTLVNRDREAEIRRQSASLDAGEIRRRLMVLEEAIQSIEGNITADLTVFSAMARVAGGRLGEGEWPAHAAARWDY
jgi:DNA polymerase-3 subunit delta'